MLDSEETRGVVPDREPETLRSRDAQEVAENSRAIRATLDESVRSRVRVCCGKPALTSPRRS